MIVTRIALVASFTIGFTQGGLPRLTTAPSGTAVLSGVLMTESSPQRPVPRATIKLAGAAGTSTRLVGTDDEGKFVFDALPPGSFTLSATKPGYVETFHGSKHPGRGPSVPVAVADGQRVEVGMTIVPGAAITGTVLDTRGQPAPRVAVAVVSARPNGTALAVRGITDDRGVYRVFGLAPGEYLVSALPKLGSARAVTPEVFGVTDAELRWARAAGSGMNPAGPMPPAGGQVTYAPVFYPGTTDVASAIAIPIAKGEERAGIDLTIQIVPSARLTGRIVDRDEQAVDPATVAMYPRRRDQASATDALVTSGAVTLPRASVSSGRFSILGVSPGDYTLVARSGSGTRGAAPPPPGSGPLWSVTDVSVDGRDQTDLVLRLMPGLKLSGTIAFEHMTLTPPADLSAMDLSLQALGSSLGTASTPRASVTASGAFTFSSIAPWTYTLAATPPGAGASARWTLKSAILNGQDLADGAFEVKAGSDIAGMTITFTDRAASISGRLLDAGGRPMTQYSVVAFPVDRALWLPKSRRIVLAQTATDGSFTVSGLPAGQYAVVAAEDVETGDLADPAVLAQWLTVAFKLTLSDGEQKRQDLRVGG